MKPRFIDWQTVYVESYDIQRAVDWCRNRFGPVNDNSVYTWAAHVIDGGMRGIDMYFQNEEDAIYFKLAFAPSGN